MASHKYIDAHLHLQDERFSPAALADIMQRATLCGVDRMFCNATAENDWQQVLDLATAYPSILPSLGVHPWHAGTTSNGWEKRLAALSQRTGAAIGEIGLDKICGVPVDIQERVFCTQLDIAQQQQETVSIHCVKSWGRLVDILKEQSLPECSIIIHSFSGSIPIMDRLLELGAFISFSTQLANPARKKNQQAFMHVPLDSLLLETDSPDQFCRELDLDGTQSARQLNEPTIMPLLYQHAARLRKLDISVLAQTLWNTANALI